MLRVAWYAAVATATVIFLVLLWQFRAAIGLFLLSLAIAAALRPIIHRVSSRRLSRKSGLAIVYILLISSIILSWLLVVPLLLRDLQQGTNDFLVGYEQAKKVWPVSGTVFQKMLAEQLPPAEEFYNSLTTQEGVGALESIFGVASGIFSGMGTLIFSIILSLYWSVDQFRFERLGLSLLPRDWHPRALSAWRAVETGVGRFIRSEVVKSVFALVALGAGFIALDLKYPVLLAMWVAIARLVPWFGVIIALAPTILIWMGISPAVGFIYAIFTLSVLIMIYRIIQPRIFVMPEYNSLPVLLLVVALGQAFGLLGVVLAPLLGLALRLLIQELSPAPRGRLSPDVLRKNTQLLVRLSGLRTALEHSSGAEVTYLVTRLQSLARKTRDYLRGYSPASLYSPATALSFAPSR